MDLWASPGWHEEAVRWIDRALADVGSDRVGQLEQEQLRPWATVYRVPTSGGTVWFKALGAGTAFEAPLYELLASAVPLRVLEPIAFDRQRAWVLLPDGGEPLANRLAGEGLASALEVILPCYGQLQRDLAADPGALLRIGVADMRPETMPARFEQALRLIGDDDRSRLGAPGHADTYQSMAALRDAVAVWCDRLSELPGPASLDHNDLHPWNMLVPNLALPQQVRFYDWGDAVVAHPFASMLVPLGWARDALDLPLDSRRIRRIRDAYLEVFSDLAPHSQLVEALELACRLGKIARALTWGRAIGDSHPDTLDELYAGAPLRCLRSLSDDDYVGGA